MSQIKNIKKSIKNLLGFLGLRKIPDLMTASTLDASLKRLAIKKIAISTVIDIGASNGCWTESVKPFYPDAFYFLIEANPYHHEALVKYKASTKNVDFLMVAAGDASGEIYFDAGDPFGGVALDQPRTNSEIKVSMTTVDDVVARYNLVPPFLLKLDTHGFEVPIFEGAMKSLQNTNIIVVEVYNFKIAKDSLMFYEICQYLLDKGFRCIDMCDPLYRAKDGILWQMDFIFVRSDFPAFEVNTWN